MECCLSVKQNSLIENCSLSSLLSKSVTLLKQRHLYYLKIYYMCVFFSPVGATSVLCPFSQRGDGGRPGGGHHAHLPAVCLLHHQGESSTEHTTTAYTELKLTQLVKLHVCIKGNKKWLQYIGKPPLFLPNKARFLGQNRRVESGLCRSAICSSHRWLWYSLRKENNQRQAENKESS